MPRVAYRRMLLVVWEALLLNKSARKCVAQLRYRRLEQAIRSWQKFRADTIHAKRLVGYASTMWTRRLASAAWRRWMVLHGLEMRVRICRTAWRLRILAETFSSIAEELLCAHELHQVAVGHRWTCLGKTVFFSWRRWCVSHVAVPVLYIVQHYNAPRTAVLCTKQKNWHRSNRLFAQRNIVCPINL